MSSHHKTDFKVEFWKKCGRHCNGRWFNRFLRSEASSLIMVQTWQQQKWDESIQNYQIRTLWMCAWPLERGRYSYITPNEPENAILHGHSTSVNSFLFKLPSKVKLLLVSCSLEMQKAKKLWIYWCIYSLVEPEMKVWPLHHVKQW